MDFCVHCGDAKDRISDLALVPRIVLATLLTAAGGLCLVGAVALQVGHAWPDTALGRRVGPYYRVQVSDSKIGWKERTIDQGLQNTFNWTILGLLLLIFGTTLFVNRRSRTYSRDKALAERQEREE